MANAKNNVKKIHPSSAKISDKESIRKELVEKLELMEKDRDTKCKAAKEQLVDMLEVTVDKYRTATGTAEALRVIRFVDGVDNSSQLVTANSLAHDMASITSMMTAKAKALDPSEMDTLCDGFYDIDFVMNTNSSYSLAKEMMCIDLCRNVGEAASDFKSFIDRTQEEMDATKKALEDLEE